MKERTMRRRTTEERKRKCVSKQGCVGLVFVTGSVNKLSIVVPVFE